MSGTTLHPHPSFSAFIPRNKEQQTRWLARPVPEVIADLLVQANRFTFNGKNILKLRQCEGFSNHRLCFRHGSIRRCNTSPRCDWLL